jgi:hypothetical protein
LQCGLSQADGSPTPVFYCGSPPASGAAGAASDSGSPTYKQVFECPMTQPCTDVTGNTSVICGDTTSGLMVTYGLAGAPCSADEADACMFDVSADLVCTGGVWKKSHTCSAKGCGAQAEGYMSAASHTTCNASNGCNGCL